MLFDTMLLLFLIIVMHMNSDQYCNILYGVTPKTWETEEAYQCQHVLLPVQH